MPLRIAYYSKNDPQDKTSWSGTTYYLGQSLLRAGADLHFLGPVEYSKGFDKIIRGMVKFCRVVLKSNYIAKYSILQNMYAVRVLKERMKGRDYDFILAPAAAPELGLINTKVPIIYMGDATFKQYSAHYKKEFDKVDRITKWEGEKLEKLTFQKGKAFVFTSHWAADSAVKDYGVDKEKVFVIPLGANMDDLPSHEVINEKFSNKELTLLFLSVDWERKGGDIAFETLVHLHKNGINAKLIVCGCIPPPQFRHEKMEVIPFLNKNIDEDHERFVHLLSTVHFLIHPTRADCSCLVACEASAYGVPSITTDVGGVSEIVKDGVNGYCLPFAARGDQYADLVIEFWSHQERYREIVETSRHRYETVLNWDAWTRDFLKLVKEKIFPAKRKKEEPLLS